MTVNLSPVGGAAAQFFDNNGTPLAGGKLFTYVAGTTTPLTTYTSSAGNIPHTNPIIFDAGGRIPGGEVWLNSDVEYKFVITTSTNTLVGTYDNIKGMFTLADASSITYLPNYPSAVSQTVEAKLEQSVSVFDFMTAAQKQDVIAGTLQYDVSVPIANAIAYLGSVGGGELLFPPGKYLGQMTINQSNIRVKGYGAELGFSPQQTLSVYATSGTTNLAPFLGFNSGTETPNSVAPGAVFYEIASTTIGSPILNVANATGIQVGDWLVLISQEVTSGSTTNTNFVPQFHQIVKVIAIAGNDLTLNEPVERTIAGVDPYSFAIKWDMVENIRIEGLAINNLYGAAYCVAFGGAVNLTLSQMRFSPESAWGAFATCRKVSFYDCIIDQAYSGFSHGRMCDELMFQNCTVNCENSVLATSERYFLFTEENPKRVSIDSCHGLDARLAFYIGSQYTDISVTNSKFEMLKPGLSAFALTTYNGGAVRVSNSAFSSYGGASTFPWDEQINATIALAFSTANITFDNVQVTQNSGTVLYGFNRGTVPIPSPTPYQKSNWILFPATQVPSSDPNALDDYEEGTFTPSLLGSTSNPTQNYFAREGKYTKIGNRLFFTVIVYMQGVGVSPGTGTAYISGLPFTVANVDRDELAVTCFSENWGVGTHGAPTLAKLIKNTDQVYLGVYKNSGGNVGGPTAASAADVTVFTRVMLFGSYTPA